MLLHIPYCRRLARLFELASLTPEHFVPPSRLGHFAQKSTLLTFRISYIVNLSTPVSFILSASCNLGLFPPHVG
jgi:hypothetical protein